ncbi:hypothetical protein CWI37_0221p0040 [Hamiltosporidium tvaerminnensis]|uniref:Uncharacterized protein n=1 Tax=Hamiltosporidium tvaerminnensis TaxID=1176355 RepID=A0A4Q9L9C1_9MICR|nr:hypothetical protein CWI37_0221p0040 [Hamiltosporidium tvaerminnensis]
MYYSVILILKNIFDIRAIVSCNLYLKKDLYYDNNFDSDVKTLKFQTEKNSSDEETCTYNLRKRIKLETNKPVDYSKYALFTLNDVESLPFVFNKLKKNGNSNVYGGDIILENIIYSDFVFFYAFIMNFYIPLKKLSASEFESVLDIMVILEFVENYKLIKFLENKYFFLFLILKHLMIC